VSRIFVPLYFLAAADFVFLGNDIVKLALRATLGLSYEILLTWAYTLAPSQNGVKEQNAGTAGVLTRFVAVGALLLGSSLSGMNSSAFDSLIRFRPYETAGQQGNTTVVAEMVILIFNSNESD